IDQRKRNQNGFVVEWRSVTWVSASSHRRRASSLLPKDENTSNKFEMEVIRDVDLNSWDLQAKRIENTRPGQGQTVRATHEGFWKARGRDKCIRNSYQKIGMRKTLVFYKGRAHHGQKTDWIMHEYRLEDADDPQRNPSVYICLFS
ncbi:hypothetical protein F2Q69_00022358, partial [Brassica cretica]